MSVKICMAIFILLSFFNMGASYGDINQSAYSLNILENKARKISEFEENSVKLQYKTKEDISKETARISEYISKNIQGNYEKNGKNQFQLTNDDFKINVKIWCEDNYNYAEIILVNKNCKYSTIDLTNIIINIKDYKSENIQLFSYYEGKKVNSNYSLSKFLDDNNLKKSEVMKINNGYTGIGYLNNNKINFALVKYDTGSHIIIGTPIIFATY